MNIGQARAAYRRAVGVRTKPLGEGVAPEKTYTVLAVYPDNGQTYAQTYRARTPEGAIRQDRRAEQGAERTILWVTEGDVCPTLMAEPFANGDALPSQRKRRR